MKRLKEKIIIFAIIISLLMSSGIFVAKQAYAIPVEDVGTWAGLAALNTETAVSWGQEFIRWLKEDLLKALRDVVVKRIMDSMVDQTITWIQGGGSPQFVTDFQGFLRDSASAAVGDVVLQTDAAFICSPFKAQIMLQLQPTPKFSENVKCTLDSIVDNIDDFYNDFSKGGWIGYAEVMKPQNNYYGVALQVSANLNDQAAKAVDAASKEIQAGSGFLSVKRCKGGGVSADTKKMLSEEYGTLIADLVKDSKGNYCHPNQMENITPGDTVGETVRNAINSDSQWAANVQSYTAALINAFINRLIKEGISMMSDSNSSSVDSAAGYTAPYNDAVRQNLESDKNAMVKQIKLFLDAWQNMLTKYNMALRSNSEVINALEQIKEMSCRIEDKPGEYNILKALEVDNVDDAIVKSNEAQTYLIREISGLEDMILEASSAIDQISALYLEGNPPAIATAQGIYAGFMDKYNNQQYLNPILLNNANIGEGDADKEVADRANKAMLAREALNVCRGGGG